MTRARGFTLTELSVAMALVAILGVVGAPYLLTNLPAYRVNGAVRCLVGDFRLAKASAVRQGLDVFIQFHSPAANQYTVLLDSDQSSNVSPGDEEVKTVDIPALYSGTELGSLDPNSNTHGSGVTFEGTLAVFHPAGGARPGSIVLRPAKDAAAGERGRERRITIIATTGRPKVYAWQSGSWQ